MDISFQNKTSDTDSNYWDFTHKEKELTLHYNTYVGISIFLKALASASDSDNRVVKKVIGKDYQLRRKNKLTI